MDYHRTAIQQRNSERVDVDPHVVIQPAELPAEWPCRRAYRAFTIVATPEVADLRPPVFRW